jgi:hypothetical protein
VKQLVSFPGILRGGRREATCTVLTTQVTLPGNAGVRHTDYSIRNVSLDLPNGQYELLANGETIPVSHRLGSWFAADSV